jgi:hypothetical protein
MRMTFGREAFFGYIKADQQPVFWFNSYLAAGRAQTLPHDQAPRLRNLHREDQRMPHRPGRSG